MPRPLRSSAGCNYVDLQDFRIAQKFFETIPVDLMQRYQFVPMEDAGDLLTVAMTDPNNLPAIDELEMILNRPVEISVSTPSSIQAVLKRSGSSEQVMHAVSEDFKLHIVKEQENGEGEEILSLESIDKDESPIIKLMHTTIFDAIQRRASDIHIEATDKNVLIKYRIDGVLYSATEPIDIKFHSAIVSRIKVMSDLDIAERRVPQDGRFKLRTGGKTIDFRVSILPSAFGEDVVIRILDKESITAGVNTLSLDSLGFDGNDLRRFRKSIREPYGMVLVTGPTGSGKTTTLYAALSEINTGEDKFITIEDPVEYQLRGVTQIPVNEKKGPHLRARAAVHPPARPGQDHGRRDPRRRNGPDRGPVRAHRPPGVHDRACQQRLRRSRQVPEHGHRTLQFRVVAQLHSRPAARQDPVPSL